MLRVPDPDIPKVLVLHDITALWGQQGVTWEQETLCVYVQPYSCVNGHNLICC